MIIVYNDKVFETEYYEKENCYKKGMVLILSSNTLYSVDGGDTWLEVEKDHL